MLSIVGAEGGNGKRNAGNGMGGDRGGGDGGEGDGEGCARRKRWIGACDDVSVAA